jgi:hypothetical protein
MILLRNITAFVLLAVVMLPLFTPAVLQTKQLLVQWQMQEALEKKELTTISIKTNTIQWVKKNKECLVNGEMFDVKRIQIVGDETLLTGLYDAEEKVIKQQIAKQSKQQNELGKNARLVKLLLQANTTITFIEYSFEQYGIFTPYSPYSQLAYYFSFAESNTPPPRLI